MTFEGFGGFKSTIGSTTSTCLVTFGRSSGKTHRLFTSLTYIRPVLAHSAMSLSDHFVVNAWKGSVLSSSGIT